MRTIFIIVQATVEVPDGTVLDTDCTGLAVQFTTPDGGKFSPLLALERNEMEILSTDAELRMHGVEIVDYLDTHIEGTVL